MKAIFEMRDDKLRKDDEIFGQFYQLWKNKQERVKIFYQ